MDRAARLAGLTLAALGLLLAGCRGGGGAAQERPIVVGSKNFTEQVVLGEIVAQHLERTLGVRVTRRLNLGGTLLAHQALTSGEIDLYPEYTGTALTAVLDLPASADRAGVLDTVRRGYRARWGIEWLDPLGFDNTFAMVVRGEDARALGIATLSDAAKREDGWRLGAGYEFLTRPDGLPGLRERYGLPLRGEPRTMDLGLLYAALESGQVDMAAANSTDGLLSVRDLVVLRDDLGFFPPYEAAIAVRADALAREPRLREALAALSGRIPEGVMRRMNYRVDGEHRPVGEVAADFLEVNGLR